MGITKCVPCTKDPFTSDTFAAISKCPGCDEPCCKAHLSGWSPEGDYCCSDCESEWRQQEATEFKKFSKDVAINALWCILFVYFFFHLGPVPQVFFLAMAVVVGIFFCLWHAIK